VRLAPVQLLCSASLTSSNMAKAAETSWLIPEREQIDLALSAACTVSAAYLFYSPMKELRAVRKSGRVGERQFLPFISTWLAASLWTAYGMFIWQLVPIAVCNAFGVYCASFYCFVYIRAENRPKMRQGAINMFLAASVVVTAVMLYITIIVTEGADK
jgi:hypothetical protein